MSLFGGLIAGAMAGGGAMAARAYGREQEEEIQARRDSRLNDAQLARDELQHKRQMTLADHQNQLALDRAKAVAELQESMAQQRRDRIGGIQSLAGNDPNESVRMLNEVGEIDAASALVNQRKAQHDLDKPHHVTTPYGSRTTVFGKDGKPDQTIDNSVDIRGAADLTRSSGSGRGRGAGGPLSQDALNKARDEGVKFGERIAKNPHPFAADGADEKSAADRAAGTLAGRAYSMAAERAAASGVVFSPSEVEDVITRTLSAADRAAQAKARDEAELLFPGGKPDKAALAAFKGAPAGATNDPASFMRWRRDALLPQAFEQAGKAMRAAQRGEAGSAEPAGEPPVTEGARPDDPEALARRPKNEAPPSPAGLISREASPEEGLLEREQREFEAGTRREPSREAREASDRLSRERREKRDRENDERKRRDQEDQIRRSREAARNAR